MPQKFENIFLFNVCFIMKVFVHVRDILDKLARCNKPKSTLACTSSLAFSRLYILMLGFIVT